MEHFDIKWLGKSTILTPLSDYINIEEQAYKLKNKLNIEFTIENNKIYIKGRFERKILENAML
jgi:hypothetical protein